MIIFAYCEKLLVAEYSGEHLAVFDGYFGGRYC